ncbi:expansin EXLX1 family cellulose-binding protein [Winogradskya humida]|uniref:Expansin (Peptidoglycan-binding protein) n=1 Tax=Winogradskya humida TaxID=113566 RepID=A0ABQ4A365_9ACTN|nr:expansin EXLX1 family cellulose-binding protein [Actinoplanes humidus]GIE25179.1 hypothetical protein Ahu01nite_082810 [Actinoplanes humidus]
MTSAHRYPRPRWLPSSRWLATGGAVLLAGVLGVALLLQNGGGACAAPPTTAKQSGKATFYDLAGSQGNCSLDPPADDLYVALGNDEYSGATSCGSYLDVTGPKGKVRVKVFDRCPECEPGHLDLSRTAFKKIGDEVQGIIPITYKAVPNAATPGPLNIEFKDGSSQFWFAIFIDNHANPIKSVQVKGSGGSFTSADHQDYNAWEIASGAGSGPFQIKMTDIYGNTATATGIKLEPGVKQESSVRFAGGSTTVARSAKTAAKTKKSASPSPSVSPSPSPSVSPSASVSSAAPASPTSPAAEPTTDAAVEQDLALAAANHC